MKKRIHILGASGTGTTTLGKALAQKFGCKHFDSDDYFWLPTNPPFQKKRDREERQALLKSDLEQNASWVLTGSMCGWGDIFIPLIDLVVFLAVPTELRIKRIAERESMRHGADRIGLGGDMHQTFNDFIEWTSQYDNGDVNIRSRALHEEWLKKFSCPVVRIEGDTSVEERIEIVESEFFRK